MHRNTYDRRFRLVRDLPSGDKRVYLEIEIRRVRCPVTGKIKFEDLEAILASPHSTKRYALQIGRRCTQCTIKFVAKEERLNWKTVKDYEKIYMQEKLDRRGEVNPRIIGVDEVSIRKGHTYRIVVSDLEKKEPIWFGGRDRSAESMDEFWDWLGPQKAREIRLVVMDMWPAFEESAKRNAPQAVILYDKFHLYQHLSKAMDDVRKNEYARVSGEDRKFIKGQRYNLLAHPENLSEDSRKSLQILLSANKRLNTAYVLKEEFGQLWDFRKPETAEKFFDKWKQSLRWQRLKPFEKFAELVESHWDGIMAILDSENRKISLGYVEGLNNKIRVLQRKAYGLRDEEYLRLKVLSSGLPDFFSW
jgi:transposase